MPKGPQIPESWESWISGMCICEISPGEGLQSPLWTWPKSAFICKINLHSFGIPFLSLFKVLGQSSASCPGLNIHMLFWVCLWEQLALLLTLVLPFPSALLRVYFSRPSTDQRSHRLPGNSPFFCLEHYDPGLDLVQGTAWLDQQINPKVIETRCAYPPLRRDAVVLSTWLNDLH